MREEARSSVLTATDPDEATNALLLRHLDVTPTGQDVLQSPYIEGMQPNLSSIGTVGPVGKKDPARIHLAQRVEGEREQVKKRLRSHKRETGRGRSPSPERTPIDNQGGGGDYLVGPPLPPPPIPTFGGTKGSWQHVANTASWLTAPQREGFDPATPMSSMPISSPMPSTPSLAPLAPLPSSAPATSTTATSTTTSTTTPTTTTTTTTSTPTTTTSTTTPTLATTTPSAPFSMPTPLAPFSIGTHTASTTGTHHKTKGKKKGKKKT